MRKTLLALLLAGFAMPASAAPFLICSMDTNNSIYYDFEDDTLRIDGDGPWMPVVVNFGPVIINLTYADDGFYFDVLINKENMELSYKLVRPNQQDLYGGGNCNYRKGL